MASCPVCARGNIIAGHIYCTLQCKRDDVITAQTLTGLIAGGQGASVPGAATQLTTVTSRLASISPSGDGTEPW